MKEATGGLAQRASVMKHGRSHPARCNYIFASWGFTSAIKLVEVMLAADSYGSHCELTWSLHSLHAMAASQSQLFFYVFTGAFNCARWVCIAWIL